MRRVDPRYALLFVALSFGCGRTDEASQTGSSSQAGSSAASEPGKSATDTRAKETRAVRLASGTALDLRSAVTITSRRNKVGDPVTATLRGAAVTSAGDTVLPAGTQFLGSITAIHEAESAGGHGTLAVAFSQVRFGGHTYPVHVTVNSMATTMVSRGVTAGDAGKVGAGAAVGAVAGRIIGGNRTGTAVGAVAGAAAGTAVAVQTHDTDITLQTGAAVRVTLSQAFERTPATTTN